MTVRRIISGGQTGADRGGLDAAIELGIEHGGFCPAGRRAEDGRIPERYNITETDSIHYTLRTKRNVLESDATVIFVASLKKVTPGSALTERLCFGNHRPFQTININWPWEATAHMLMLWTELNEFGVLNIAGSRESRAPGIQDRVRRVLVAALSTADSREGGR